MKYEPIKERISSIIGASHALRKLFYAVLGIVLLRAWHVKRELRRIHRADGFVDVLDAGCGLGQYSYYLVKKFGANVVGVDVLRSEVDRCVRFARAQRLGNLRFIEADLSSEDLSHVVAQSFDLVVSVDVMEHIRDDNAVFRNFAAVLRENGRVVISTPSSNDANEEEHSFIDEHFRSGYLPQEIKQKLEKAGLEVEKITFTYGFGGSIYWKLIMKIPITLLNKSMLFFFLLPFYYVVAFPIALSFMALDYFVPPKGGGGLLVVARRM
jgi:SAM-dependent methyltransferase